MLNYLSLGFCSLFIFAYSTVTFASNQNFEQLLKKEKACHDLLTNQEHLKCMKVSYQALLDYFKTQQRDLHHHENINKHELNLKQTESLIRSQAEHCRAEQIRFGAGSLGERRHAYCLNQNLIKTIKSYEQRK